MYTLFSFFLFPSHKLLFPNLNKISHPKIRSLITFRSLFLTYKSFPGRGWLFPVGKIEQKIFNQKLKGLAGLTEKFFHFSHKYRFWPLLTTWVQAQRQFPQRTGKESKNHWIREDF